MALIVAPVLGCTASGPAEAAFPPPGAGLGPCPEHVRPHKLRCARVEVPFERADPALGTLSLAYGVRPRDDLERPSLGPIFAVEGGPGYGSIGSGKYYVHMLGPLLRRHELVLIDMRGTGHSEAIDCPGLQTGRTSDTRGVAECAELLGERFASYRTSAAADDIDAVREVLGYERIALYGDSYGTFLGQSYAFRHGHSLEALVLDSAYPVRGEDPLYPSLWRTGIDGLRIACDRSARCDGNAARRLRRVLPILRESPRGVGPLLDAIAFAGYEPPIHNYVRIDLAVKRLLGGRPAAYRRLIASGSVSSGNPRFYSRGDELAVSCNDYPMLWEKSSGTAARERELRASVAAYPPGDFAPFTPPEVALESRAGYLECLAWPQPTALYEPPADPGAPRPGMPTLVISGELDDVTSPSEGADVAADFANSRQRVITDAGHVPSLYGGRYPAREMVRRFFRRHPVG